MRKSAIKTLAVLGLISKIRNKKEPNEVSVSPTQADLISVTPNRQETMSDFIARAIPGESVAGFCARMQDRCADVTITVSGPECAGKTALLGVIEELLKEKDITVKYQNPEEAALQRKYRTSDRGTDWDTDLRMYKPIVTLCEALIHKG